MERAETSGPGWFTPFLMVACIALGVVVVLMSRTISRQSAERAALHEQLVEVNDRLAKEIQRTSVRRGDAFGVVTLRAADGTETPTRFDWGARSTMVLVVSGGCEACAAAVGTWRSVVEGPHPNCDVIVMALDTLPEAEEAALDALGVDRFVAVDGRTSTLGGLRLVPATILIGPDGVIERVWHGVVSDAVAAEMSEALARAQ